MPGRGRIQEIVIGVIPVVLGISALTLLPDHAFFKHGFPSPTTPDFFPSLVGVFLVLLGLFLLARVKHSEDIQKETHEAMVSLPVYQSCVVFFCFLGQLECHWVHRILCRHDPGPGIHLS